MGQAEFARYLRAAIDRVIQEWEAAVRTDPTVPTAQGLNGSELTDHLPPLLERIAVALEGKETPDLEPASREHGSQRRRVGYDIAEVLCEHSVLRQTLLDQVSVYASGSPGLTPEERDAVRQQILRMVDRSGRAAAAQYHAEAIAERQALEAALEAADRRKDEALAMVAHELRNPRGAISNALQLLRISRPDHPAWERALNGAERQVRFQVRLVEDLLDISRVAGGKIELQKTRVDLRELIQASAEDCRSEIEEAGLALALDLPAHPVRVEADPTRLSQVLVNLLNNAVKFTDPGGRVTVALGIADGISPRRHGDTERAGQGGGAGEDGESKTRSTPSPVPVSPSVSPCLRGDSRRAVITVSDTGIGIEPELLARLFEPFAQVEGSRERSRGGLGLGLALVKGLVELHGGTVTAHSGGPGQGSEFVIRLPVVMHGEAG